jgi:hypothetical protein
MVLSGEHLFEIHRILRRTELAGLEIEAGINAVLGVSQAPDRLPLMIPRDSVRGGFATS